MLDVVHLGQLVLERARLTPDRPAFRFGDARLSFGEVERASARIANRLTELGVEARDRVGVMMPNGIEYALTWLGVVRLGAVVVPINTGYQDADLRYVLTDSGAATVITVSAHVPLIDKVGVDCPALERVLAWDGPSSVMGGNPTARLPFRDQVDETSDRHRPIGLDGGTLSVLQYTSGTTGFPKGCMIPHGGWLDVARQYRELGKFTADDVALIMTPFYYGDFGWNLVLCLHEGMELVMLPRFSASTLWRSVAETGATFFYCLGAMPVLLLKQPEDPAIDRGHRMRWISCSGIPADQHRALEARWGVPWREAYGTTEIGFVTATTLDDDAHTGSGSIGRMLPGFEGRLVGPDGADAAPGEPGEFICRGRRMSAGYWNKPEATAAWMRNGWAHTGDVMTRDADGYYYLVGRTKDMIRRGGENVAAAEVEAVLCDHPAVANAACIAVPDPVLGEEIKAFIQPKGPAPDPGALLAHCRQRLAAFKVPRYVAFIAEFPLTPSQRVEKHRLSRETTGCHDAGGAGDRRRV